MSTKLINIGLGLAVVAILAFVGLIVYQRINPPNESTISADIKDWEQAVQDYPDDATGHANLGALYRENGELEKSIAELKKATELSPEGQTYWHALAESYKAIGDQESALEALNKAAELYPEYEKYGVYYEIAEIQREQGDNAAAKDSLTKAIADNDVTWDAHFMLGQIYQEEGDNTAAKREYQIAAAFTPGNPEIEEALQQVSS